MYLLHISLFYFSKLSLSDIYTLKSTPFIQIENKHYEKDYQPFEKS